MPYLSKSKLPERLNAERHLVEAIRDKLDALANAQLKQDRPIGKRKQDTQPKRTKPKSITHLKNEIHLFLASVNIHPHRPEVEVEKANREESWLIRLDWDGKFHMPADTDYSEAYARSRQIISEQENQADGTESPLLYKPEDYLLYQSPSWLFMRRFSNYQRCQPYIQEQLALQNIPPEIVGQMNFFDFAEVLYNWSKRRQTQPFESQRSQNFKMFDACYGKEFEQVMRMLNYKPEYIEEVRQKMQRGNCDAALNFHHKTNVSNFKELEKPYQINQFANTMLTFVQPHHRTFHFGNGYDADSNIVFFGGYDKLYQIQRDPERERQYLQSNQQLMIRHADRSR